MKTFTKIVKEFKESLQFKLKKKKKWGVNFKTNGRKVAEFFFLLYQMSGHAVKIRSLHFAPGKNDKIIMSVTVSSCGDRSLRRSLCLCMWNLEEHLSKQSVYVPFLNQFYFTQCLTCKGVSRILWSRSYGEL